jgi:hypothetical protein
VYRVLRAFLTDGWLWEVAPIILVIFVFVFVLAFLLRGEGFGLGLDRDSTSLGGESAGKQGVVLGTKGGELGTSI